VFLVAEREQHGFEILLLVLFGAPYLFVVSSPYRLSRVTATAGFGCAISHIGLGVWALQKMELIGIILFVVLLVLDGIVILCSAMVFCVGSEHLRRRGIVALLLSVASPLGMPALLAYSNEKKAEMQDLYIAVDDVDHCAFQYFGQHKDFPSSLESMGPAGSDCLDEQLAYGDFSGYRIQYLFVPGQNGSFNGFNVTMDAHSLLTGMSIHYSSNETGSIWVTKNQKPKDLLLGPVQNLFTLWHYLRKGGEPYPSDIAAFLDKSCVCDEFIRLPAAKNELILHYTLQYHMYYSVTSVHAGGNDFAITVRPAPYGKPYVMSYYLDNQGRFRVTPEDRAPTLNDPTPRDIPTNYDSYGTQ